jgi:hypothetical protein
LYGIGRETSRCITTSSFRKQRGRELRVGEGV